MRLRAAVWMCATVAACAAVSAVAFAQGSTWGGAPQPASVPDAGSVPPSVESTWGTGSGAVIAASPPTAPVSDAGAPTRAKAAADAGADSDASAEPASTPPSEVGFSAGVRGGYALPIGTANVSSLSSVVQGVAPVGVDVGWFFSPNFYVGGYFLYGFGVNPGIGNDFCSDPDSECSATMYRFGVVTHWHFRPKEAINPWVGAGIGYEVLNIEADSDVNGSTVAAAALQGFIVSLEAGLDFKPLPYVGLGPYVELATGQYIQVESFSPHAWLSFGLRLRTNL